MAKSYSIRPRRSKKLPWILSIVVLVLLVGVGVGLRLTVFKPAVRGAEVGNTGSQETKGEPVDASTSGNTSTGTSTKSNTQPGDQKSEDGGGNTGSTATLLVPTGNFVSNHMPDQAHPNETSVCTTTPGATCQITFTKDGVTKALPAQTTDRGGSTYWNNWKTSDIDLTAGSWKVRAVASLNGKTQTADDAIDLMVAQ